MVKRAVIEAKIVTSVETVLLGGRIEDERIECKSELIPPDRARQLAGSANAALGDDVIWIVGIDEQTKTLVPQDQNVDLAQWWAQVSRRFDDGVTPDLTSLWVPVPGGTVLALHFTTDRAPYVVRHPTGGSPELEVPWRSGTGTRSAKRHELLRILLPAIRVPPVTLLHCDGTITAAEPGTNKMRWLGQARLYVEHTQNIITVIPAHRMSGTFNLFDHDYQIEVKPRLDQSSQNYSGGIEPRPDGFYCRGPGVLRVDMVGNLGDVEPDTPSCLQNLKTAHLRLRLGVVGATKVIHLEEMLKSKFDSQLGPTMRVPMESNVKEEE